MRGREKQGQRGYVRRHPRFSFDKPLILTAEDATVVVGRTLDISVAGLGGLLVSGSWTAGTLVSLEFPIQADSVSLKLRAFLRSRSGNRCGFELVAVTAAENDLIRKACEALDLLE
ncbi:MAG: PilZ domain-containing protein [Acidobacteriia bacterium]|nr:PilZ domain-containing protein [Terriglobia bacterium]